MYLVGHPQVLDGVATDLGLWHPPKSVTVLHNATDPEQGSQAVQVLTWDVMQMMKAAPCLHAAQLP